MTPFGPHFHSKSDSHDVFHVEKFETLKYLKNWKRYLQTVNGARLLFVGSFISYQPAFWVNFPFKHDVALWSIAQDSNDSNVLAELQTNPVLQMEQSMEIHAAKLKERKELQNW